MIVVGIFCKAVTGRTVSLVFFSISFSFLSIIVGCVVQCLAFLFVFFSRSYLSKRAYLSLGVCGVPVERVAVYSGPGWAS